MSGSEFSRRGNLDRLLKGTVAVSPVVAMLVAPQPAQAVLLSNASNTVSLCSGVQLPRSDVTSIITPIAQVITPLETDTNGLLRLVGGTIGLQPVNTDISSLLTQASQGSVTLSAVATDGTVIGPSSACYAQANGVTLSTPAGISLGGNAVTGLGDSNQNIAAAGEINSIALGNNAKTDALATGSIAIGTNSAIGIASAGGVAVGTSAGVTAANGVALGNAAQASATGGIAIGSGASATAANSVALGATATATRGAMTYTGYALTTPTISAGEVSVGATGATRQLTNVAAGLAGTDAVNVAQLTAVNTLVQTNTTAIGGLTASVNQNTATIATNISDIAGLKTNVTKNTADIATNVGAIAGLTTSVGQNTAAIATNTGDIASLKTSVNQNTASIVTNTGDIAGLKTSVGQNTTAITANTASITGLGTRATTDEGNILDLTGKVTTNSGDIAGLKTSVGQNTTEIAANTASIAGLGTRATTDESNILALTGKVASNTGAIAGLATSVGQNTASIATNSGDIANLKAGVGQNTTDIAANAASITGLGARVTTDEGNILDLTGKVTTNTGDIANLKTNVGQNTTDIAANAASIAGLGTRAATDEGSILDLAGKVTTNTGDIANLKTNVGQNTTDIAANAASIAGLGTRAATDEGNILDLTGKVTANTGDIANLKTNVGQNTTDIAANAASIAGLGTRAATDEGVIATLTGNVQTNTDDITTIDARVTRNTANISVNATAIADLGTAVTNGAIGPVQYSDAATPTTPNKGVPSDDLTLVGKTGGAVGLHDVAAGMVSATSTDAVNGSQIYALESQIPGGGGLGVAYDSNAFTHVTLGGVAATSRVGISNLADGSIVDGSSDAVTGSQLFATNQSVGTLSQTVGGLSTTVSGYGGRLDTLDAETARNATAIGAVGTRMTTAELNIASLNGLVTTNTSDIATNTAAISAIGDRVRTAETGIAGLDTRTTANTNDIAANVTAIGAVGSRMTTAELNIASLGGQVTTNTDAIAADATAIGAIGSRVTTAETNIAGLDMRTTTNTGDIAANTTAIAGLDGRITTNANAIAGLDTRVATNASDIVTVDARVTGVSDRVTTNTNDIATLDGRFGTFSALVAAGGVGPVQYSNAATPTAANGGVPTNDLTLVGAAAAPVGLHNVAAGTLSATSTDAVNGGQLYAVAASITGETGLAVAYDDADRAHVTLGGASATARVGLSNVADGAIAAGSGDAVTGGQLYATNQSIGTLGAGLTALGDTVSSVSNTVTTLGTSVASVSDSVATLSSGIQDGALGTVRYSDAATPTAPNGGVPSQDLTLVGANVSAPVGLHNLADGRIAAGSSDAVTGNQLNATNMSIATVSGDVDRLSGVVTGLGGTLSTVSNAVTALGSRYADLDGAFTSFAASVSDGAVGPVRYSDAATPTVANGGVPSNDLTLVGAGAGTVGLHNLSDGRIAIGSGDAVTGGQLATIGNAVASTLGAVTYDSASNSFTGDYTYDGNHYATVQAALDAIRPGSTTTVDDGTGIKYFHTNSSEDDSQAMGANATAIGAQAIASGDQSVAMGNNAQATGASAVAIGDGATAQNGQAVSIGVGNMASGDGAVSIGDPNSAVGEGAVALGKDNTTSGLGAVALGNTNSATGEGAVALGSANATSGAGAVTLGYSNVASGIGAIAIGSNNDVSGDNALALGSNVKSSAVDTLAIGSSATATAASALAVGNRSMATGEGAISVGTDSSATRQMATAYGDNADATGVYTTAIGAGSQVSGIAGTAIGTDAVVAAAGGTAIGTGATVGNANSVALGSAVETTRGALADYSAFGLDGAQNSVGEIAIAQNMVHTDPNGQPTPTGNRQITGVAAGSADTDAVNVSQLRGVSNTLGSALASGLGGGARYSAATGQVTGGSYTVSGVTYGSVGDALAALASRDPGSATGTGTMTATDPAAVHYGDATGSTIALAPGGTLVSNVAAGGLTAGSTDAVNGSQLAATNSQLAATTAQTNSNTGAIATLASKVDSGATGTVQYSSAGAPTASNGGIKSNDVTLVGADASAPVALHNVASGSVASGSTDAVNGGQLAVTNARVATVETTAGSALAMGEGSVQYDDATHSGVTLGGPSAAAPVAVHNVADGADAHDAANVGQLVQMGNAALGQAEAYTDTEVARLSFDIDKVKKDQAGGTAGALALAGMPQPYEAGRGMVSMGVGTFLGQSAIAVGLAKALSDEHTVVKLGATYNSRGSVGANAGIGYQF